MTSSTPNPKTQRRWRLVGQVLAPVLYRFRVEHADRIPANGPVVLIANHVGFVDGPLCFVASPRPVHFLVKRSYFSGLFGVILRATGQIPITQNTGDREALTAARAVLQRGGVVGIFPEGTRGEGDVKAAQQGAAFLALGTKATLVPVALNGTRGKTPGAWPRLRSQIVVTVGEPFTLASEPDIAELKGAARLRAATEVVRSRLSDHVKSAKHTAIPANPA